MSDGGFHPARPRTKMTPRDNPYLTWMRDRLGEPTPTEAAVSLHLGAIAAELEHETQAATEWLSGELAARVSRIERSADDTDDETPRDVPRRPLDDEVFPAIEETLLQGACGELDRLASSPARAAYIESAIRYAREADARHALELPPESTPTRADAAGAFRALLAERQGLGTDLVEGLGESLLARGAAVVRRVLYAEASGHADPATLRSVPLRRAGFTRRAVAYILDYNAVGFAANSLLLLAVIFGHADGNPASSGLTYAGFLLALVLGALSLSVWAATPGRLALGLEVRRVEDGRPLRLGGAMLRQFVGEPLNFFLCSAGFWTAWWRPDRRTWADRISGSLVVRNERPPWVRRPLLLALVLVFIAQCMFRLRTSEIDQSSRELVGEDGALLAQVNTLAETMDDLATRDTDTHEQYRSDMRALRVASLQQDSIAQLERKRAQVFRRNIWLHPDTRRTWARADSLLSLGLEKSRLLRLVAEEGLTVEPGDEDGNKAPIRHMRYLMSDVRAVEAQMTRIGDAITNRESP